jgi:hypothetical protein
MSAFSRALLALSAALAPAACAFAVGGWLLLCIHLAASAAAAFFLRSLIPTARLGHPRAALVFLFVLCALLPVAGPVIVAAGALTVRTSEARRAASTFSRHAAPAYADSGELARSEGPAHARLANPAAPTQSRLRALLAMQSMPARAANAVIRQMLADGTEDLRLVAYGILDGREKSINARIHACAGALAAAPAAEQVALHRELAELYNELVYQRLVQGDLRAHAVERAEEHVRAALEASPEDAALHALAGQVAINRGDARSAQVAFERARVLGLPESRVLPYLAEVAFQARRFAEARAAVRELAALPEVQEMERVVAYWSRA